MGSMRHFSCLLLALGMTAILPMHGVPEAQGVPPRHGRLVAGALNEMTRVGLTGKIKTTPTVQLYAARGEYEPFQVAVEAQSGPIECTAVTISDLRNGDKVIRSSDLPIFREHFVHVEHGSRDMGGTNRPLGAGMYADALIPAEIQRAEKRGRFSAFPAIVTPGTRAVFWIDVFVPRQAAHGAYRGTVTVSSREEKITIPVSLTVWRQALPLRPSLHSSFGITQKHMKDGRMAHLLLKHHLMPFLIEPDRAVSFRDNFGLNTTGLPFFGDVNKKTCTMNPAPKVGAIRAAIARYPKDIETYEYAADEIDICPSMFPALKQWSRNVHEAGSKMLVTVEPAPELLSDGTRSGRSAVDIWVLLPKMYDDAGALVQKVLKKGDQVWSYNALVQDSYSPKWEIDFAPVNYRIQPGFLSQSLNLTGLLYSEVDIWNSDPWVKAPSLEVDGFHFPGEDMLVYPGAPAGSDDPLPSMRLKWLRKGVEDYESVEMLKQAGRGDWALQVVRTVALNWHSWTRDPEALDSVHRKLGEELDRIEAERELPAETAARSRKQTIH